MIIALQQLGFPMSGDAMHRACGVPNNMHVLNYLYTEHCPFETYNFLQILQHDQMNEFADWLLAHGFEMHEALLTVVSRSSKTTYKQIKCLLDHHCPVTFEVAFSSISFLDLDSIQALYRVKPVQLIATHYMIAIHRNKLDIMDWLFEQKCPLTFRVWKSAAGNPEMLDWLRAHQCTGPNSKEKKHLLVAIATLPIGFIVSKVMYLDRIYIILFVLCIIVLIPILARILR
jgi:hypothetical protein